MNNSENYEFTKVLDRGKLKFLFNSEGHLRVTKVVEYTLLEGVGNERIYNFGFGDYDSQNDYVNDTSVTNNGDVYKVYNTVLSTVPVFFDTDPDGYIFVQGSDSSIEFYETCKASCKKKCEQDCKNQGRRISIYRSYINKNFNILNMDYAFWGGLLDPANKSARFEDFEPGKIYNALLICKR